MLDDEGAGGDAGVVAADEEAEDLGGDVVLVDEVAVGVAGEEHVGEDVLGGGGVALGQVDLALLDYGEQLLAHELGGLDGFAEHGPREVYGDRYYPRRNLLEPLEKSLHLLRIVHAHEQTARQPECVAVSIATSHLLILAFFVTLFNHIFK